jgi:hypothetical protein
MADTWENKLFKATTFGPGVKDNNQLNNQVREKEGN